jgi:hypothetical protein
MITVKRYLPEDYIVLPNSTIFYSQKDRYYVPSSLWLHWAIQLSRKSHSLPVPKGIYNLQVSLSF